MVTTQLKRRPLESRYAYSAPDNTATPLNVGLVERWVSTIVGGGLTTYGVVRQDGRGVALTAVGAALLYRGLTGHSFLYQALNIVTVEQSPSSIARLPGLHGIRVRRSVTINRSASDLYAFWHAVENAPLYMPHVEFVESTGNTTSHWVGKNVLGRPVEWNSHVVEDKPGELISWQCAGPAAVGDGGSVHFTPAPTGRGTQVTLELDFSQFSGVLGASIGKIVGHIPEQLAQQALRRFKALMETGEIATVEGQSTGKGRKERNG